MVVYKSLYPPIPLPDLDLYTFLFSPNEYSSQIPNDRKVIIDGLTGRSLTRNQVRDLSGRLATGWIEKVGLKKGDVVASFAPNQYDHIVVYASLLAAKCTITPGNPSYTEAEFLHQIANSGAQSLITVPELLPVLLKVCEKVGIPKNRIFLYGEKDVQGIRSVYSIISNRSVDYPIQGLSSKDDVAFICYSSGTTGLPKGVMLTHQNFISQTLLMNAMDEEKSKDSIALGLLPFYHIFGLSVLCLNAFYKMQTMVVIPKFDLQLFCELVQKYKITNVSIVPPIAVALIKHPLVAKYDLSSIRIMGCGAAPLGKEHVDALSGRIPGLLKQGFGMTETTSGVIAQRSDRRTPGSIGILCPNMECKIVDDKGNELGDDQEGELLIRGPSIMKGYLNNPKANAETLTADGWLHTGDVCKFDSKTQEFFITDRLKELIKYKGFQVAPAELESLLLSMPDVADACVIGVYSSSEASEFPRAYIVPQASIKADEVLAKKISDYVASRVANHKKLRGGVRFLKQIPKSNSGKILRRQVREMAKKEEDAASVKAKL